MPGDAQQRHEITTSLALPPTVFNIYTSICLCINKHRGHTQKHYLPPFPSPPPHNTLSPPSLATRTKLIRSANNTIARSILSAAEQDSPVIVSVCVCMWSLSEACSCSDCLNTASEVFLCMLWWLCPWLQRHWSVTGWKRLIYNTATLCVCVREGDRGDYCMCECEFVIVH